MQKPEFAEPSPSFVVDYDEEKDVMQSFGVRDRSTLIAFQDGAEVAACHGKPARRRSAALLSQGALTAGAGMSRPAVSASPSLPASSSVLSPCVLPMLPLVLRLGGERPHRFGRAGAGCRLAISFTVVGLFVAVLGYAIGLDEDFFRWLAAILFVARRRRAVCFRASRRVSLSPEGRWPTGPNAASAPPHGAGGPFVLGLLLGAVWVPCVGPTIGAASLLAAQRRAARRRRRHHAGLRPRRRMPLAGLGLLSRQVLLAWRGRLGGARPRASQDGLGDS